MEFSLLDKIKIKSNKITTVSYDPDSFTLHVDFTNGESRQFFGVPGYIFEGLLQSPQKDQYYTRYIAHAGFSYELLDY
ncbi:MAG TPA: KTSC domain-containing protein [bacterium]|nr:KTSC domain-containing protein [bacterium]HPN42390.1 KTSC domain-containing protein [bacterium]